MNNGQENVAMNSSELLNRAIDDEENRRKFRPNTDVSNITPLLKEYWGIDCVDADITALPSYDDNNYKGIDTR